MLGSIFQSFLRPSLILGCVAGLMMLGLGWFFIAPSTKEEPAASLEQALEWLQEGNLQAAEESLKDYLQQNPRSETANEELRWLYFNLFRVRDVERVVRHSLEQFPGRHDFLMHALMTQHRPPVPQEGIGYLEQVQKDHPDQALVLLALGYGYWQMGQLEKAREFLNKALAKSPHDPEARLIAAEFLIEQNQTDAASELLGDSESADDLKDEDRWWWLHSRISESKNDFSKALAQLEQALKLRPAEIKYIHRRGMILKRLGRDEEAAEAYRQANEQEALQMKLTEIVLSGAIAEPTPALCEELARLCDLRGQKLLAEGWRILAQRLKSGLRPNPITPSF